MQRGEAAIPVMLLLIVIACLGYTLTTIPPAVESVVREAHTNTTIVVTETYEARNFQPLGWLTLVASVIGIIIVALWGFVTHRTTPRDSSILASSSKPKRS